MTLSIYRLGICCLFFVFLISTAAAVDYPTDDLAGVEVRFDGFNGAAKIHARTVAKFSVQIDVEPQTETEPFEIYVELPNSGKNVWPSADVEVVDRTGRALAVRRIGIEWNKMWIPTPAVRATYFVRAVPSTDWPKAPSESERQIRDATTGLSLSIAHWKDGRKAALSVRFDDGHPTQLSKAMPLLRQFGYRGTFMVNPGDRENAPENRWSDWEAVARSGEFEFANHTLNHRGARNDEEMEREVGEACQRIWKLFPGKSKLLALNLGGGTKWTTTKTLRYYLDKYHLFDASSGSLGMDDVYGQRVDALRRTLRRHIDSGGWCRIHYHSIGEGYACSEDNFRAALNVIREHEPKLWIAGMADIYKYRIERAGAKLEWVASQPDRLSFRISFLTDPALYDEPLTLECLAPESWKSDAVVVKGEDNSVVPVRARPVDGRGVLRFNVPAVDASYTIRRTAGVGR